MTGRDKKAYRSSGADKRDCCRGIANNEEELFRLMADSAAEEVYLVAPDGHLVYVNKAAADSVGYTVDELLAIGVSGIDPDFGPNFRQHFEELKRGPVAPFETVHISRDGTPVTKEILSVYLKAGEREYVCGVGRNITTRKKKEGELLVGRERLDFIMSGLPVVVYTCRATGDYGATYISQNVREQLGFAPDDFTGNAAFWADHIHPADRDQVFGDLKELLVAGMCSHEYRFRHQNGTWRWMRDELRLIRNDDGTPREILGIWSDVTARRESEQQLLSLFTNMQEGVALHELVRDPAGTLVNYRIVDVNPAYERILSLSRNDVRGKLATEVYGTPEPPYLAEFGDVAVTGKSAMIELYFPPMRRHFDISIAPWGEGGFATIFTDITDRKRAEDERIEMERRLLHGQKLESIGMLAGGIAHDFNNLLTVMLGNLELALIKLSSESPAREHIEQTITASHRAAELTRQILAYAGKGRFVLRLLDLSEAVEENVHLFKVTISKRTTLSLRLRHDLPAVEADPAQVQQVIMNLITNAAEAIGDKAGVIVLETGASAYDAEALKETRLIEAPPPGVFVHMEVSDTGAGMNADTIQKLFDPFFTTKASGRGLGMAAIQGIVRAHRGAIFVSSEPEKGTTIRVLFPAIRQTAPAGTRPVAAGTRDTGILSGTVLLVDDEDMVREVCREILEQFGLSVLTAGDGNEAVRIFEERSDAIDLVILDFSMPGMNGFEAFTRMREIRPDVRALLASGFGEEDTVPRFTDTGFAGFLQKPFQLNKLRTLIGELLGTA